MRISDWSSDVCSSDLAAALGVHPWEFARAMACLLCGPDPAAPPESPCSQAWYDRYREAIAPPETFAKYATLFVDSITVAARMSFAWRSEEHASELQSLMRNSYAVFCLHNQTHTPPPQNHAHTQ